MMQDRKYGLACNNVLNMFKHDEATKLASERDLEFTILKQTNRIPLSLIIDDKVLPMIVPKQHGARKTLQSINPKNLYVYTGNEKRLSVAPELAKKTHKKKRKSASVQISAGSAVANPDDKNKAKKSASVRITKFKDKELGSDQLTKTSVYDLLENLGSFLSTTDGEEEKVPSFVQKKEKILLYSQACYFPYSSISNGSSNETHFNPLLIIKEAKPFQPTHIAIVGSKQGTSCTIVGRYKDDHHLWYNENGRRTLFTANIRRFKRRYKNKTDYRELLDVIMVILVPLNKLEGIKEKNEIKDEKSEKIEKEQHEEVEGIDEQKKRRKRAKSKGILKSKPMSFVNFLETESVQFKELDDLPVTRAFNLPITCSILFYQPTTTGVATPETMNGIARLMNRALQNEEWLSTILDFDVMINAQKSKDQKPYYWEKFWKVHEDDATEKEFIEAHMKKNNTAYPKTENDAEKFLIQYIQYKNETGCVIS